MDATTAPIVDPVLIATIARIVEIAPIVRIAPVG